MNPFTTWLSDVPAPDKKPTTVWPAAEPLSYCGGSVLVLLA